MKLIRSAKSTRLYAEKERLSGRSIGFVPTMGALHDGHLSLIRAARRENERVFVSIFVNPMQFGPHEDYRRYPRTPLRDRRLLNLEKVDVLFCPGVEQIYSSPPRFSIDIAKGPLTEGLCGKFRPGHFKGVATVVAKLFHIMQPHRAYFGAKDYQQAMIIQKMIRDLDFNVRLRLMPIVREPDGMALSSRNSYLKERERRRALSLSQTLFWFRSEVLKGGRSMKALRAGALARLRRQVDKVDYFEVVHPETLEPLRQVRSKMLAAVAAHVGKTRLIDNVIIRAPNKSAGRKNAETTG